MRISSSDLINLPVFTEGGRNLGRVHSFDIDIESFIITRFYVKTNLTFRDLLGNLSHEQLIIAPSQVISISQEKMVVKDGVVKEPKAELGKIKLASPLAE